MNRVVVSALVSGLLCAGVSSPAWAQYKVVGPDGRVTYTDRPPVDRPSQAVKSSGTAAGSVPLPYTLRNVVARYPVTLYTSPSCSPCNTGRNLLTARGVPFTEKTVNSAEDASALKRLSGETSLPFLSIGGQQIKGFSDADWTQYLDAAGYPKQSVLPSGYRRPAATALVATQPAQAAAAARPNAAPARPPVQPAETPVTAPTDNPAGIRF